MADAGRAMASEEDSNSGVAGSVDVRRAGNRSVASEPDIDELVRRHYAASGPIRRYIYFGLGCLFAALALAGVWVPGWPTVSWAVPAAFMFSLSSERLFRWSLSNPFFGRALYRYYAAGKTLPKHAKRAIAAAIAAMSTVSAVFVFRVSYPADPGFGPALIALAGAIGVWYVLYRVPTRRR